MKGDLEAIREKINQEIAMDCGRHLPGWEDGRYCALSYLLRWIDKREQIKHVPLCPDDSGFPTSTRDMAIVVNQLVDAVNGLKESRT